MTDSLIQQIKAFRKEMYGYPSGHQVGTALALLDEIVRQHEASVCARPQGDTSEIWLHNQEALVDAICDEVALFERGSRATLGHHVKRAIAPFLKRESSEHLNALKALGPFEVVQGDVSRRINPHSGQVCNSTAAWAVSNGNERSAHKIRKLIEVVNTYIEGQKP